MQIYSVFNGEFPGNWGPKFLKYSEKNSESIVSLIYYIALQHADIVASYIVIS